MILLHYNNTSISCTEKQYTSLILSSQILSEEVPPFRTILEKDIRNAIFNNDDIYYSLKYLFDSKSSVENNMKYFSIARLICKICNPDLNDRDIEKVYHYLSSFQ